MKKPDVVRLLRAALDPEMKALGFRWTRMFRSSDGWYVREWDGGRDTFGWGIASYSPKYVVSAFATVRIDAVENLIAPHVPFCSPDAAREAFSCNVNDVAAFVDGPDLREGETMGRAERWVESEIEIRCVAGAYVSLIRERIEPWWRSLRCPEDLYRMDQTWRRFFGQESLMRCLALAFLCASSEEQERIEREVISSSEGLHEILRSRVIALARDLRARRA